MKKVYLLLMGVLAANWSFGQACTNPIAITPTAAYSQNFDNTTHGWTATGTSSSWVLGTPAKTRISGTASGTNAWVTGGLGTATYNSSENSQVVSPCFNMSALALPVVEMKIWWDSERGWDGAVLQSSIDNGATWQVVGAYQDPNNWYNDNSLDNRAGGQSIGWSGTGTAGSGGYVTAKHILTGLGGQANVRFRIAFGSDTSIQYDGFAFDDFNIYETPANDLGVTAILAPVSGCGLSGTSQVQVRIKNFGSASQTNFPVTFQATGPVNTPLTTATYTGPAIAPNTEVTFTFPQTVNLGTNGTYTVTAATAHPGDNLPFNNTSTTTVTSIPSFTLTQGPTNPAYFQDFENTTHGWTVGGTNSSWALGTPAKTVINSAFSGSNSWVTSLTGSYNNNEKSFVKSPCFNMAALGAPVLEMRVWWNSEFSYDGAVLQSSVNGGATWQNVGTFQDPIGLNWYNDNTLNGAPGDQPAASAVGWTGRNSTSNGSGGWLLVKRDLTGLGGQSSVILRVAFGSEGSGNDNGFAFDDVKIYDKPANDMATLAIVQPISGCGLSSSEQVAIQIRNEGSQPQTNIPVGYSYTTTAGVTVTKSGTYAGTLAPGASDFHIFTGANAANLTQRTIFTFKAWTALPNENPVNRANDTIGGYEVSNVLVKPTNTAPYVENFEQNRGGWEVVGANSSWAFGTPSKLVINGAASGTKAWVTGGLGSDAHNASEQSYVVSPCMDFTAVTTPVLEMKVWWHSEFNKDGAAVQSSIDGGTTWQLVGNMSPDWYNSAAITGNPGAQQMGWSGNGPAGTTSGGSGGWVSVRQVLTGLNGKSSVILRVVFGADATNNFDGFAFDDVMIYNRPNHDLSLQRIEPISQNCGLGTCEKIRVNVKNWGLNQADIFSLTYTINGGGAVTQNFDLSANPLNPGEDRTLEFTTCANLSNPGSYNIQATVNYPADQLSINNSASLTLFNSLYVTLPVIINFEAGASTISQLSTAKQSQSNLVVSSVAGNASSFGLLMEGGASTPWTDPIGFNTPWNTNLDHISTATLCVRPTIPMDSLIMNFDLKQIYKALFSNTAFRVTVNGAQVGPTYHPPVTGPSTAYTTFKVDLSPYLNKTNPAAQQVIRIGFESNVREKYNAGAGTANFLDNIFVQGYKNGQPVGVKESFAKGVSVFPNPSSDVFKVQVENAKNFTVEVMDLSGRLIMKKAAKGTETTLLDMTSQAKGIYLMRIVSQEGNIATRKLVLQ